MTAAATEPGSDSYRETLAFLSKPSAYPDRPEVVQALETHMSHVFIAGNLVYKMKKSIRLAFVDFTTLEARRANCERELALNQRLAPGIYLDVVPLVRRPAGGLRIGGEGEAVEWLLVMRRLDASRLLGSAIGSGEVAPVEIDGLCDLLAGFYAAAPRIELSLGDWLDWWREGIALAAGALTDRRFALPRDRVDPALKALTGFLDDGAGLLAARLEQGRVLDGHGDLRPEHVYLGPPILLIDRLEFDPRLRWTDPFDEVGFLGLECARLGAGWIGERLTAGLSARLGETPPARLLRFYRCYRACLRARLSIEHLRDPNPRTPERWPRQAREYLDLAHAALPR